MKINFVFIFLCAALGAGCTSITGIEGSSSNFACKAPDGVTCTSVSGVYSNAQQNNLPALMPRPRMEPHAQKATPPQPSIYNASAGALPIAFPGMPIRSQSKTLRVWVTPWTDDDGDLHDQSFVYLLVDPGRWMVEHTRAETVKRSLVRLKPLPVTSAATAAPQTNDQGRQPDSTNTDGVQSIRSFNPEKTE